MNGSDVTKKVHKWNGTKTIQIFADCIQNYLG